MTRHKQRCARAVTTVTLLALAALGACRSSCRGSDAATAAAAPKPPNAKGPSYRGHNIIIVSVDTLRADHLGAHGYQRPTSPRMDALAKESVLFERAFAPRGHTWPSLVSLLTALYPPRTNVRGPGDMLEPGLVTVVETLEQSGYETAAFLANFCQNGGIMFKDSFCKYQDDQAVTERAIAWLDRPHDRPFFLWLHLMSPHAPFRPPPDLDRFTDKTYRGPINGSRQTQHKIFDEQLELSAADLANVVGLYDGDVLWSDAFVGKFHDALKQRGLLERSIVVLTSDHGEELYQHHKYMEHGCSIYDSVLHIPMALRLPDGKWAGQRRGGVVGLLDLMPTLFDLVGVPRSPGFDGESFVDLLPADRDKRFPAVISEHFRRRQGGLLLSIRTRRWRYIYNPSEVPTFCLPAGPHFKVAREELYDHDADPLEQRNVVAAHPEVAAELQRELLANYPVDNEARPARKTQDPETLESLKSLGYIGE